MPPYPATVGENPMRTCLRCGTDVHMSAEAQPHLCKDVAARLKRQEAQVARVKGILHDFGIDGDVRQDLAEEIVGALNHLGVTE